MASFFGEIITPSSRAVGEDEEEDADDNAEILQSSFQWSLDSMKVGNCLPCQTLCVTVGKTTSGFAKTYLLNQSNDVIGWMSSPVIGGEGKSVKSCVVHRLTKHPDVLIALCEAEVPVEQAYSIVEQLFAHIAVTDGSVTILSTVPVSRYQSDMAPGDLNVPFLRALKSTSCPQQSVCPYLEQPNTITDLPAQILSYCQVNNIKAVLYACYTDVYVYVDYNTMKTFTEVLKSPQFNTFIVSNPKAGAQMVAIADKYDRQNTLYM